MSGLRQIVHDLAIGSTPYKAGGVALVSVALGVFVYASSTDARSAPRRLAVAYAADLDTKFKSMFVASRGSYLAWLQGCAALMFLALYGFVPTSALLVAAAAVIVLPALVVRAMVRRRLRRLNAQVHGFALALANALKTTASIGDALWVTVSVTATPLREELETALKQVRVGSSLENALLEMAARAGSTSLDAVVTALLIGRQTGGDLPRILEGTSASLRELSRLEELTQAVTREAKSALGVAAATTLGLVIGLPLLMPGFFDPLVDNVKGQLIAAQCAIVFLVALVMGYRFTRMDV